MGLLDPPGLTKSAASGLYLPKRAAMRFNPANYEDGFLPAEFMADTGQPMTAFPSPSNPAPLGISGGAITNTPANVAAATAGYMQVDMGARVRRMGAMVSWPLNALGVVALVIPSAAWATGVLPNAGFHLGVNGNGLWTLTRFTTGGSTTLASAATHGRFDHLTWGTGFKPIDVWIDPDKERAVITWPDGTTSTISSAYFAIETGNYAIWELFSTVGSTDVAASLGKLWADTAPTDPDVAGLTSYQRPGRTAPSIYPASGSQTLDLAKALVHVVTLSGNLTNLAFSNPPGNGAGVEVQLVQDATGSRLLSAASSAIKWAGAALPVLTTTANRRDIFRFRYVNGVYYEVARAVNVG